MKQFPGGQESQMVAAQDERPQIKPQYAILIYVDQNGDMYIDVSAARILKIPTSDFYDSIMPIDSITIEKLELAGYGIVYRQITLDKYKNKKDKINNSIDENKYDKSKKDFDSNSVNENIYDEFKKDFDNKFNKKI